MMDTKLRWLAALGAAALLVVAGVAFIACGGSDDASTAAHEEGDTHEQDAGTEQSVIGVSLAEWSIEGLDGTTQFAAPAGETTFEVHNEGSAVHELVIIKTDTDPAALAVEGGRVDEDAVGEEIGEIEEFPAAEIETGTFTLEPGKYALICNIPGHYEQGMYAQLVVE